VGQRKKATRYAVVVFALSLVIGILAFLKFSQISVLMAMDREMEKAGPPPEAVASAVAQAQTWERTLSAIGSVTGVKGVALSSDASGRVEHIHFESGAVVEQGQVLVELDTSVERARLASAEARLDLARVTVKRSRTLAAGGVITQTQLDNDEAQYETARRDVAALKAEIERRVVRAPFGGRLGIRAVDVGQYLNPGTPVTVLEDTGVFVDFTLPQRQLESIGVGMQVRVASDGSSENAVHGAISAVDPTLDSATRHVRVRASLPDRKSDLRPGMFVHVAVVLPDHQRVVAVPATAIVHAPYGDSVFVIEERKPGAPGIARTPKGQPVKTARQQFVRLGESRGDFVAVARGLKAGERVVSAGAFKLRNGSPVVIDNRVKPEPSLNPRPENR
jgi:membrane fusion protein (multidrug efflux system)